jgi:FMN phosphatase YigB (HAD superfamily)
VFLFDVDNTLLDNDRITADLGVYLENAFGAQVRDRFWEIFEALRTELDYADYLGTIERYRIEAKHHPKVLRLANWLMDYPFSSRLYPKALDVVQAARAVGPIAILSDGDAVFQPRKVEKSGLWPLFGDNVLIYVHKERHLADVAHYLPARHYVVIDDKLRILDAIKRKWGDRVTTIFPRQGHYATDAKSLAEFPPADISINHIAELLDCDFSAFRQ